jgi:hypothetical protein
MLLSDTGCCLVIQDKRCLAIVCRSANRDTEVAIQNKRSFAILLAGIERYGRFGTILLRTVSTRKHLERSLATLRLGESKPVG